MPTVDEYAESIGGRYVPPSDEGGGDYWLIPGRGDEGGLGRVSSEVLQREAEGKPAGGYNFVGEDGHTYYANGGNWDHWAHQFGYETEQVTAMGPYGELGIRDELAVRIGRGTSNAGGGVFNFLDNTNIPLMMGAAFTGAALTGGFSSALAETAAEAGAAAAAPVAEGAAVAAEAAAPIAETTAALTEAPGILNTLTANLTSAFDPWTLATKAGINALTQAAVNGDVDWSKVATGTLLSAFGGAIGQTVGGAISGATGSSLLGSIGGGAVSGVTQGAILGGKNLLATAVASGITSGVGSVTRDWLQEHAGEIATTIFGDKLPADELASRTRDISNAIQAGISEATGAVAGGARDPAAIFTNALLATGMGYNQADIDALFKQLKPTVDYGVGTQPAEAVQDPQPIEEGFSTALQPEPPAPVEEVPPEPAPEEVGLLNTPEVPILPEVEVTTEREDPVVEDPTVGLGADANSPASETNPPYVSNPVTIEIIGGFSDALTPGVPILPEVEVTAPRVEEPVVEDVIVPAEPPPVVEPSPAPVPEPTPEPTPTPEPPAPPQPPPVVVPVIVAEDPPPPPPVVDNTPSPVVNDAGFGFSDTAFNWTYDPKARTGVNWSTPRLGA